MKKQDLARRMARSAGVSRGEAADRLDRVVRDILARVREGRQARLPGLGRFVQGADGALSFEPEGDGHE